jgi:hypothetical protein
VLRPKLVAVLAASSLAAGALAGCGHTSKPSSGPQTSSKPNVLAMLASDVKGSLLKSADTTAAATSVTLTFTGTSAGKKVSGSGHVSFSPSKLEMTVDDGTAKTTIRFIDKVIYVQLPADQRADLHGKSWMKLDGSKAAGSDTTTQQYRDIDPVKQIKTLLAGDNVSVVGQEDVNGVPTVHYLAKVPLAKYLGQVDASARTAIEKEFSAAGATEMSIDAWVDEQYRPRRIHLLLGSQADLTMDYTDYGKPVQIEAPPAKDTVDFEELLRR